MKITAIRYYGGARDKICRLALADLFLELQQILFDTNIELVEAKQANSAGVIREQLDKRFEKAGDWVKTTAGGIDWVKRLKYNQTLVVKMGVEVQVSARSDLLIRDIVHLRNHLQESKIDVGVIVVPSDRLQTFLPDRTPSLRDAVRYIEQEFKEATTFPIVLMAVEHDAPGKALPKKKTNIGKASN